MTRFRGVYMSAPRQEFKQFVSEVKLNSKQIKAIELIATFTKKKYPEEYTKSIRSYFNDGPIPEDLKDHLSHIDKKHGKHFHTYISKTKFALHVLKSFPEYIPAIQVIDKLEISLRKFGNTKERPEKVITDFYAGKAIDSKLSSIIKDLLAANKPKVNSLRNKLVLNFLAVELRPFLPKTFVSTVNVENKEEITYEQKENNKRQKMDGPRVRNMCSQEDMPRVLELQSLMIGVALKISKIKEDIAVKSSKLQDETKFEANPVQVASRKRKSGTPLVTIPELEGFYAEQCQELKALESIQQELSQKLAKSEAEFKFGPSSPRLFITIGPLAEEISDTLTPKSIVPV